MANNIQNLKPLNTRTKEERRKIAVMGGKASGKSRAFRKSFKEAINDNLDDKTLEQLIKSMISEAKKGNTKAFEILRDTVGEKPIDRQEIKEVTSSWFKQDD